MRLTVFFILFASLVPCAFSEDSVDREQRLIEHARYCLLNDLILSARNNDRQLSTDACRAGELGIAFIGERTSKKSIAELAKLRRYVLDGALGESYTCYVLLKGNRVLTEFGKMDLSVERRACEAEVVQRLKELSVSGQGTIADAICAKPNFVENWIRDVSTSVRVRRKCDQRDW